MSAVARARATSLLHRLLGMVVWAAAGLTLYGVGVWYAMRREWIDQQTAGAVFWGLLAALLVFLPLRYWRGAPALAIVVGAAIFGIFAVGGLDHVEAKVGGWVEQAQAKVDQRG